MDTQAVKPTYQDAFMVAFGEPEGESVKDEERQKKTIISVFSTTILRNYAKDEIRTLLQHGHRRKNIFIRELLWFVLRHHKKTGKPVGPIGKFILKRWGSYSFSIYFCWHNEKVYKNNPPRHGEKEGEHWDQIPDFKLSYDNYERDPVRSEINILQAKMFPVNRVKVYNKNDFDWVKSVKIKNTILDIMEPLVNKQLPKTRLNCWMNADNIKIEITNE